MKNKTHSVLIDMAMEDFVGDSNDTCICEIAGDCTKGIGFGELRTHISMVAVVSPLVDDIVKHGILGTAMTRLGSRKRDVGETSY